MPGIDFHRLRREITMEQVLDLLAFQPSQRTGHQWYAGTPGRRRGEKAAPCDDRSLPRSRTRNPLDPTLATVSTKSATLQEPRPEQRSEEATGTSISLSRRQRTIKYPARTPIDYLAHAQADKSNDTERCFLRPREALCLDSQSAAQHGPHDPAGPTAAIRRSSSAAVRGRARRRRPRRSSCRSHEPPGSSFLPASASRISEGH